MTNSKSFYGFFQLLPGSLAKVRQHGWKERHIICKGAKYELDFLKITEDIAPQKFWILRTFVGGEQAEAPTIKASAKCRDNNFTEF